MEYDFVIAGGGQAGRRAAEGVIATAPGASLLIIGEENHLPYDRPPLSKQLLANPDGVTGCYPRDRDFYSSKGIQLLLGERVSRIDRGRAAVFTEGGRRIGYRRLILATGSRPRRIPVPADVEPSVHYLRTIEDALRLRASLARGAVLGVLGGGLIGLEVAATARGLGASVVVMERRQRLLPRVLPAVVADRIKALHEEAGVDIRLNTDVLEIRAGRTRSVDVVTSSGIVAVDLLLVGIGVVPNVELARDAGLDVPDGIAVTASGQTADPSIFAAGEVTSHPVPGARGPLRLESWQVAEHQAYAAGCSAAGRPTAHSMLPWSWSDQYDHNIQILGHLHDDSNVVRRPEPGGGETLVFLDEKKRMIGLVAINAGRAISAARRLMTENRPVDLVKLADPAVPWRKLLTR